jgi:hypothetical protein
MAANSREDLSVIRAVGGRDDRFQSAYHFRLTLFEGL